MKRSILLVAACTLALATTAAHSQEDKLIYPESKKISHTDEYFGTKVPDPFQWLENDVRESDEVREWVTQQSAFTADYLADLPFREVIESRITKLWNYEKFGTPSLEGGRYYFSKNDGLQNQSVLYRMDSLYEEEPTVVLDPNKWSDDGTAALSGAELSSDGKYIVYATAVAGSDWSEWKVMEIESGKILDDLIEWTKFSGVSFMPDDKGFIYTRFPEPEEGQDFQSLNKNNRVYYHKIGTSQADDVLVYEDNDNPDWGFAPEISEDGKYMVITVWKGTDDRYQVYFKELKDSELNLESDFTTLIGNFDNEYSFIGNQGSNFFFKTNLNAPNGCVMSVDVAGDDFNWQVVVPESKDALSGVSFINNSLVCSYLPDAKSGIKIYGLDGSFVRDVELPGIGTASGFGGKQDQRETFYSFSSFATPPSTYRYDMQTGESTLFRQAEVDFNPDDYVVQQVFYESKDGTRVPMFICHAKGVELDGTNPTLLYGYGGFNISLTPSFSVTRLQWMEMGGVFALANLRGGGEYGKAWHKAGTKTTKQNVFDDFIAAAEYLIENKYTSAENLGIQGGSNGGLLVGACMTQRPDLFGACLPAVGVMDMLKFQNWTAGRYWVDDYGSSAASAEEFEALYKYSPYHNLKDGVSYPPTLVTTADTDDRVVPGHSFKFAARLQEAHEGSNPVLIRIEVSAGHGAGKPTSKRIEETADQWAFLVKHLGMKPNLPDDE